MSIRKENSVLLVSGLLVTIFGIGWTATVEKREMPANVGYGGPYGGYDQQAMVPYAGPPPQGQGYGPPPGPQYGQTPYTNPGFSVQTGFEGFLVPNSWYGLLPWGVEGVVVVIVAVIVFVVIAGVLLGLLAWLSGFGDYAIVRESAKEARNLLPNHINYQALTDITNNVLDALDKYDELQVKNIN